MIGPFGMMAVLLSSVVMTVFRMPISATCHLMFCIFTRSPILYGLKNRINKPQAKLVNEPWSASHTARPAAHNNATKEVVCTPNIPAIVMISKILRAIVIRLVRNLLTVTSILDVTNHLITNFLIRLMIHNQITKLTIAPKAVGNRVMIVLIISALYSIILSEFILKLNC